MSMQLNLSIIEVQSKHDIINIANALTNQANFNEVIQKELKLKNNYRFMIEILQDQNIENKNKLIHEMIFGSEKLYINDTNVGYNDFAACSRINESTIGLDVKSLYNSAIKMIALESQINEINYAHEEAKFFANLIFETVMFYNEIKNSNLCIISVLY